MALEAVGLSPLDEEIYRVLLQRPNATLAEIADAVGSSEAAARRAVLDLERLGLVARTPHRPARYVASSPASAIGGLITNSYEALESARHEAARLEAVFQTGTRTRGIPLEVAVGRDAALQHYRQIQQDARDEVVILERPPYAFLPTGPNPDELTALRRGVSYRVLYSQASLEAPGKLDKVRACVAAGEQARLIATVPFKLIAVDRRVALTYEVREGEVKEALVLHHSALLDALLEFFEVLWDQGVPLRPSGDQDDNRVTALQDEISTLLAAGVKDDAIARHLGISDRTVRRHIAELMRSLGARTRFQAGLRFAQRSSKQEGNAS